MRPAIGLQSQLINANRGEHRQMEAITIKGAMVLTAYLHHLKVLVRDQSPPSKSRATPNL